MTSNRGRSFLAVFLVLIGIHARAAAPDAGDAAPDLSALSIEELSRVEVTSASRKDQKVSQVAAAVFVITAEDIRRSGASNVPELLRMAPGIQVAQISSNIWAVSSRGFNGRGANRMLVMVDGRSIYNSLFAGTFWDQNQVPLELIEQIEVIRGPGATLWGANAVDGVINIITKKAKSTQCGVITADAGQSSLPDAGIGFGGKAADRLQYRLNAGFGEHPPLLTSAGANAPDRWSSGHGDLRVDYQPDDRDSLSFSAGAYQGGGNEAWDPAFPLPVAQSVIAPFDFSGGYVMGRWQHQFRGSDIAVETYYDRETRHEVIGGGSLNTIDFDFQHHIALGVRNDFIWGMGLRLRDDDSAGVNAHAHFDEDLVSFFAQDDIAIVPNRLTLTLGTRLENFITTVGRNFSVEPQVRLLWALTKRRSLWTAVSRTVHSPSEVERDMQLEFSLPPQNGLPTTGILLGNAAAQAERAVAYEAGYRQQIGRKWSVDLAFFLDRRTGMIELVSQQPYLAFSPGPALVVPQQYANSMEGYTRGVEASVTWTPVRKWRLQAAYSREDADLGAVAGSILAIPAEAVWRTPRNTLNLHSAWDLTRRWRIDSAFAWVSRIPESVVPAYTRVDLHVARKIGEASEISVGVRNLFDEKHLEFTSEDYVVSSLSRRDVYAGIMWRF